MSAINLITIFIQSSIPPCTPSCQIVHLYFTFPTHHQVGTSLPYNQPLVGNSAYHNNDIYLTTRKQFTNILFATIGNIENFKKNVIQR